MKKPTAAKKTANKTVTATTLSAVKGGWLVWSDSFTMTTTSSLSTGGSGSGTRDK